MNSQMKQLTSIWNIMTSEPVTTVIVMGRTSGLGIRNGWSSIPNAMQYK